MCREYIIGLSVELERRRIEKAEPSNVKRQLELAAYFTHCRLQPSHTVLTLRQAMAHFSKAKNYSTAATFAKRVSDLSQDEKVLASVGLSICMLLMTCTDFLFHITRLDKSCP